MQNKEILRKKRQELVYVEYIKLINSKENILVGIEVILEKVKMSLSKFIQTLMDYIKDNSKDDDYSLIFDTLLTSNNPEEYLKQNHIPVDFLKENLNNYLLYKRPDILFTNKKLLHTLERLVKYNEKLWQNTLTKEKKVTIERKKAKNIFSNIFIGICVLLIVIIISLYSNIFSYWIAVVGSGSMSPTIQVGDAIIVDKTIKNHLENLKVGDILVFRMKDSIYTHRVVDIKEENSTYLISTKGDRKGQVIDNWTVKNDDIVGIVKFKVSYIGYPTVLLNRFIKENKR